MNDIFTYDELEGTYRDLLQAAIPSPMVELPNVFEISGFPHYERVISNWYAFFFDTAKPHGLSSLFIDSLCELIQESEVGRQQFETLPQFLAGICRAEREWLTMKGNYIDLLLFDECIGSTGDDYYPNAVIIENKIFASLYNDLNDYFDSIPNGGCKIGVLLSVHPLQTNASLGNFVSLSHKLLIERVLSKLGSVVLNAHPKYLNLLMEFFNNLLSLSSHMKMDDEVRFSFTHAAQINQLVSLYQRANEKILIAVKDELNKRMNFKLSYTRGNEGLIGFFKEDEPDIVSYIYIQKLLVEKEVGFDLWLRGQTNQRWLRFVDLEDFRVEFADKPYLTILPPSNRKAWGHVAVAKMKLEGDSFKVIEMLPELIAAYMVATWLPLIESLRKRLSTDLL